MTPSMRKSAESSEQAPYLISPPILRSISIYMDVINIFVRLVAILSGSGKKR